MSLYQNIITSKSYHIKNIAGGAGRGGVEPGSGLRNCSDPGDCSGPRDYSGRRVRNSHYFQRFNCER